MTTKDKIQKLVRSSLPEKEIFHVDIRSEWGSENLDHRKEIRNGILEYLKLNHPAEVADSIWDLNSPPVLKSFFVSISHCNGSGGFVLASVPLGFDIEETSRIDQRIIDRVSTEEELKVCPEFALLWPAKESVFKCSTEFYTITHIQILTWEKSQDDTYTFKSLTAFGWAFKSSAHSYAIAIKKLKL